jgi:hypothetical protein
VFQEFAVRTPVAEPSSVDGLLDVSPYTASEKFLLAVSMAPTLTLSELTVPDAEAA